VATSKKTARKPSKTASKPSKPAASPAPKRPRGVPAAATFDAKENEWQLGSKKGSRMVGEWSWWRADGTLGGRSTFDDEGELHGVAQRFHSGGEISMESRYVHGVRWGKTRHTRSRKGDSPEDMHMAALPDHVFEVSMAYAGGQVLLTAACNEEAAKKPPKVVAGHFEDFERAIKKYEAGTAFMVLGTLVDIAKQRFDVPVLFYDGPAHEDYSILRFSFAPPGTPRKSKVPTWQDPEYGTAISLAEAKSRLLLAVDAFDVLASEGRMPPDAGFKIEVEKGRISIRDVAKKGAAAKAGLRAGDVIASMNGKRVKTLADYMLARGELARTNRLALGVERGKEKVAVELVAK
jgi:hypothetical protein